MCENKCYVHHVIKKLNHCESYIDKENHRQYVNTVSGLIEQIIPEINYSRIENSKSNSLLKNKPEIYFEWDFVKNRNIDIYRVSKAMSINAWWICQKCGSSYQMMIANKLKSSKCTFCHSLKINHTNSLNALNPTISSEWHPIKNGELLPTEVSLNTSKKIWWLGKCGHEWTGRRAGKIKTGCPYCASVKILRGFNDMWTSNPSLAELLLNPDDGFKYSQWSNKQVDWKCHCGNILRKKDIGRINKRGLPCNICKDGVSFPEKIMTSLLYHSGVNFDIHRTFEWEKNKVYDFYLIDSNTIVEVHGMQHYEFCNFNKRTVEEEKMNDVYKMETALLNGISDYIIIDAKKSDFNYIRENIVKSHINKYINFDLVSWDVVYRNSLKSNIIRVCELYNEGFKSKYIMNKCKISETTYYTYIKKGKESGIIKE